MLFLRLILVALAATALPSGVQAELTRIEIDQRRPFADGQSFGAVGSYESIRGRFYFEVDPDSPANAAIADLQLAETNDRGRVEFWSDFVLLTPQDPVRGNRRLLYDVTNRGNLLALWTFNDGERSNDPVDAAHAGNGFLMRQGYSLLWSGWNGDVVDDGTDRLLVGLPVVIEEEGLPVRGRIHLEISVDEPQLSSTFGASPWGVAAAYPSVDIDDPSATLTERPDRSQAGVEVPRERWRFARWEASPKNASPESAAGQLVDDPRSLYLEGGFKPGWLYDLTYTAEQPRVAGLGMAGIRDAISFLRYGGGDAIDVSNPLAAAVDHTFLFGISQSGRLVHHFVYDGFNADTQDRTVFDGMISLVGGAGRGLFNQRFGLKTLYSSQHRDNLAGTDIFPFATLPQTDPVTGEQGDLLRRARDSGHVPKLFFVQSSSEYWARAASLLHTDVQGQRDIDVDPQARVYLISGSGHLGAQPPTPGIGKTPRNPLRHRGPVLRALLVSLDRWISSGVEPPPSRYPRIDDGTLVSVETFRRAFPQISGVDRPTRHFQPLRLNFGPRWKSHGIADIVPPEIGPRYQALVPQVDSDGNELPGIRLPEIAVPLATHTGWSLRSAEVGAEGMLVGLEGSYVPFPITEGERRSAGDPRPSVLDRYPSRQAYLAQFVESALELHRDGYLLAEDALQMIDEASQRKLWD